MNFFFSLLIFLYFTLFCCVKASEDPNEAISSVPISDRTKKYSQKEIEKTPSGIGRYTSYNQGKKITENSEWIDYEESSLTPLTSFDAKQEFIEDEEIKTPELELRKKSETRESSSFDGNKMDEVNESRICTEPYRFFGSLLITFPHIKNMSNGPKCKCIGSGVLIGPNHILTAGHNIYDYSRGGWATQIIFTPAQCNNYKPFGDAEGELLQTFNGWVDSEKENYDMGIIILDKPIGYQAGWASLLDPNDEFLKTSPKLIIAGYPDRRSYIEIKKEMGIDKISKAQMLEHSSLLEISDNILENKNRLFYKINTLPGQSGSPVMYCIDNSYFILGVHTNGGLRKNDPNEGTRLTENKFNRILNEVGMYIIDEHDIVSLELSERDSNVETHIIGEIKKSGELAHLPHELCIQEFNSQDKNRILNLIGLQHPYMKNNIKSLVSDYVIIFRSIKGSKETEIIDTLSEIDVLDLENVIECTKNYFNKEMKWKTVVKIINCLKKISDLQNRVSVSNASKNCLVNGIESDIDIIQILFESFFAVSPEYRYDVSESSKIFIIDMQPVNKEDVKQIILNLNKLLQEKSHESTTSVEALRIFQKNVTDIYSGKNGWIISQIIGNLANLSYEKRLMVVKDVIKERNSPLSKNQYQKESDILNILKKFVR